MSHVLPHPRSLKTEQLTTFPVFSATLAFTCPLMIPLSCPDFTPGLLKLHSNLTAMTFSFGEPVAQHSVDLDELP